MSRTNKKKAPPKTKEPKKPAQTLEEVLELTGIEDGEWDVLLIGDGSGTSWDKSCGWGVTLITSTNYRNNYSGSFSNGTNNIAEIMAYMLPLMALSAGEVPLDIKKGCKVFIVTDSQYVANGVNERIPLKTNGEVWAAIQSVRRLGIDLKAVWVGRDEIDLNRLGHSIANKCRIAEQNCISEALGGRNIHLIDPTRPKEQSDGCAKDCKDS